MKVNRLLLAGLVSLSLASGASAQNKIYITGSTAFRGAAYNAIVASFDSPPVVAAYKCAQVVQVPTGFVQAQTAGFMNFRGNVASADTLVKCAWSGSEAGYIDVAKTPFKTESFMADGITTGVFTDVPATADSHTVDIAMADNTQAFSKTPTPAVANIATAGVVPFVWDVNAQSSPPADYTRIVNISAPQVRALLQGGVRTAQLTGVSTDTKFIYVAGRDNNSGTRVNAFLAAQLPTVYAASQIKIGGTDGAPSNETVLLQVQATNGESSGGTLAGNMDKAGSATAADGINGGTGWYAVAYLGLPDAFVAESTINGHPGAVRLTYNGVAYSVAAVQEAQYTYWGLEQCALSNGDNLTTSPGGQFFTLMNSHWATSITSPYEISFGSLNCTRASDNADPIHNP
jgi:hypothetical protein